MGSTESVAWEYAADIKTVITALKEKGYKISALEISNQSKRFSEVNGSDFPMAMIIGNEVTGVDNDVMEMCDFAVEIPQYGIKQSINVAVAFGIGIYGLVDRYRLFADEKELPQIPEKAPEGHSEPDID